MIGLQFGFIPKEEILKIMPLMQELNAKTEQDVLKSRILDMVEQNYKCIGIYNENNLIGICGLWFLTRHYCGKTVEPDHVIIDKSYQGKGIGRKLFDWIFDYAKQNGLEASELNSYVENTRSHKFYYNLGYEIKGYHFVKHLE
jgi:GNAT superfamily N-acetyltransferase